MTNTSENIKTQYSPEQLNEYIAFLESIVENGGLLAEFSHEQRSAFLKAVTKIASPDPAENKRRHKASRLAKKHRTNEYERRARALTGIRVAREAAVFSAPLQISSDDRKHDEMELNSPRNCYICKAEFTKLHFFYDTLCNDCAQYNYQKRFQTADLTGQIALITGSRLKIGYQSTLMMLRAGARVIATTRFPVDSASRYSKEKDFSQWKDRIHIYGLDLRHTPSVELFCNYVENKYQRLDILVNNAAQTVRRPPGFYAHLIENELKALNQLPSDVQMLLSGFESCKKQIVAPLPNEGALPITWTGKVPGIGLRASAQLSQIPYAYDITLSADKVFPKGKLDADLQQVDLREMNSWRLRLGEIETAEMFELQLVNAIAPFVLCNKLAPLMKQENTGKKHIVNVSAMEGKFHRFKKIDRHPHTNMAKAALNMLTHTSAGDLARFGIYMNAVDTGWVTDEDPIQLSLLKQQIHDFQPPLDIVDGAARVCDPFFNGILTGQHWCGKFLKDYQPIDW